MFICYLRGLGLLTCNNVRRPPGIITGNYFNPNSIIHLYLVRFNFFLLVFRFYMSCYMYYFSLNNLSLCQLCRRQQGAILPAVVPLGQLSPISWCHLSSSGSNKKLFRRQQRSILPAAVPLRQLSPISWCQLSSSVHVQWMKESFRLCVGFWACLKYCSFRFIL